MNDTLPYVTYYHADIRTDVVFHTEVPIEVRALIRSLWDQQLARGFKGLPSDWAHLRACLSGRRIADELWSAAVPWLEMYFPVSEDG